MRALVWIAALLTLFVLAWAVQTRWTLAKKNERDAAYGLNEADLPPGFGRAVVGNPSGAPIVEPARRPSPASPSANPARGTTTPLPTGGAQHVVAPGESLSKICAAHYGTSKPDVVEAVARANKLADPKKLREGATLVLPPLEELTKKR